MLRKVTKLIQMLIKRWVLHKRYLSLLMQVKRARQKIKNQLDELNKPIYESPFDSDQSRDQNQHMIHKVTLVRADCGGFQARIEEDNEAMDRLKKAMQSEDSQLIRDIYDDHKWELKRIKQTVSPLPDEILDDNDGF